MATAAAASGLAAGKGKLLKLTDVFFANPADGLTYTSIYKITHPHRRQKLMVIALPRYAYKSFYSDWVDQPYQKEHTVWYGDDLQAAEDMLLVRHVIRNRKMEITYYSYFNTPDSLQAGITRKQLWNRTRLLRTPLFQRLCIPSWIREKNHPWVPNLAKKVVGENYLLHPSMEDSTAHSFVVICNANYAHVFLNTLLDLNFEVADVHQTAIGKTEEVERLTQVAKYSGTVVACYLWFIMSAVVYYELDAAYNKGLQVKQESEERVRERERQLKGALSS